MLIHSVNRQSAQPTSTEARHTRRMLSAAGGVLAALALILSPLAPPESATAEGSATAASGTGAWPWPLLGDVITPYRNGSDPYAAGQHRGLDIAAPVGSPVLAIVEGRVSFSGSLPDGGQTVTVASAGGEWLVSNLHLSARNVARGDQVHSGDLLGRVGMTGRRSAEQPHLHLGVRRASSRAYVDPMTLLGPQRLPAASASRPAPAAVAQPATPAVRARPIEARAHHKARVHAQSTGDSSPATRHGAHAGSTTTRRPAGANAREGHAADKATSRVAPPPLEVAAERSVVAATPAETASVHRASPRGGPRAPRGLLIAIAAICMIALLMRRRPDRATAVSPPTATAAEHEREAAAVVELSQARKAAGGS